MHNFLSHNRDELIARYKAKVAKHPQRLAAAQPLANGIPMFLEQLTKALQAEEDDGLAEGARISGASGGDATALSEIRVTAAAHGKELMEFGYTVDRVIHDYGDLCQSISDLAVERNTRFSSHQFRAFNRCLDNAIADAVTEFSLQREATVLHRQSVEENERLGFLVHELRNVLQTARMSYAALESGRVVIGGATGDLLKRSLDGLSALLDEAVTAVRAKAGAPAEIELFSLASFVADARNIASLGANARGGAFTVPDVDPLLAIKGNRAHLLAGLVNLLHNAFKFTHAHTQVVLHAYAEADRILVEVKDHCGGLPKNFAETIFRPFTQGGDDKSGLGLGLSIARRSVEADGGTLTVRDLPGTGCVFTISLPRHKLP